MILGGLWAILLLMLRAVLVLLPNYTPPPATGLSVLAAANFVLPLAEIGVAVGVVIAYVTASLGYMGAMKLIAWIRGSG